MRIGITSRVTNVNDKEVFVLYKRYTKWFSDCEFIMILPNQSEEVMSLCDCFIITGGDDLNPKLYYQENINSINVNEDMDDLDFKVLNHAIRFNKKVLGICRGIQSINVFFGGTLKQEIKNHSNVLHEIYRVDKRNIDLGEKLLVNSYHHQSVDVISDKLLVLYMSGDGEIEMIVHKSLGIVGVQFHPEISMDNTSNTLFSFLVE